MLDKLKKNYFILIITFLFIYFFFNLLDGERGLISYIEKKDLYERLKKDKNSLSNKIEDLEHKNSLLTDNIDLDFIEILIRDKLNCSIDNIFKLPEEDIIMLRNSYIQHQQKYINRKDSQLTQLNINLS